MMSSVCYLGNNPVVKKLVKRGVDDRWTFLAYASGNEFPFSKKPADFSKEMKTIIKLIDFHRKRNRHLTHSTLWQWFSNLTHDEIEFLTDYIITSYKFINHDEIISLFGSYENMLNAMDSNSGAEYDISEIQTKDSDAVYIKMIKTAAKNGWKKEKRTFADISDSDALLLFYQFAKECSATNRQIMKFMHMSPADFKRIIHQSEQRQPPSDADN